MLGYVVAEERGAADVLLRDVAEAVRADGMPLAAAVQVNTDRGPERACHMDLHILPGGEVVRISQDLGALSRGCRLDPGGLERAVGLVKAALDRRASLLIVNKFGKQELEGRGFGPVIADALGSGVPVLTAVNRANLEGFEAWAGGLGERLPPSLPDLRDWVARQGLHTAV